MPPVWGGGCAPAGTAGGGSVMGGGGPEAASRAATFSSTWYNSSYFLLYSAAVAVPFSGEEEGRADDRGGALIPASVATPCAMGGDGGGWAPLGARGGSDTGGRPKPREACEGEAGLEGGGVGGGGGGKVLSNDWAWVGESVPSTAKPPTLPPPVLPPAVLGSPPTLPPVAFNRFSYRFL